MEKTESSYAVFGAAMTVDTKADLYSEGYMTACKSCQCNCRLCRGRSPSLNLDEVSEAEAVEIFKDLLAA